jgi:predicted N-formylglutamate amidohydrolase
VTLLSRFSRLLIDPKPLSSDTLIRPVADGVAVKLNSQDGANNKTAANASSASDKRTKQQAVAVTTTSVRDWSEDRRKRIKLYYEPYHAALQSIIQQRPDINLVLSIHRYSTERLAFIILSTQVVFDCDSFTPMYEGQPRKVEVGVLFHEKDTLAKPVTTNLDHSIRVANVLLSCLCHEQIQQHFSSKGYDARLNEPWSGKEVFTIAFASHMCMLMLVVFRLCRASCTPPSQYPIVIDKQLCWNSDR